MTPAFSPRFWPKMAAVMFLCVLLGIVVTLGGVALNEKVHRERIHCSEIIEGHQTDCFDSKGVQWLSFYPVNYVLNGTDEFRHAQICSSGEEAKRYRVCIEEVS